MEDRDQLTPADVACLRMLAGAHFHGGEIILPSGRPLTPDEAQAFTSAYAPAAGEAEPSDAARTAADWPGPATALYLSGGGDPGNERTMAILAEADRHRTRVVPEPAEAPTPARRPTTRKWPMSWWYTAAVIWSAAVTAAATGIYAAAHSFSWWTVAGFPAALAVSVVGLYRSSRDRRRRERLTDG
jgi:hypothetical protein